MTAFPKPVRRKQGPPGLARTPIRRRRARRLDRPNANPDHLEQLHHRTCEVRRIEYRPGYWRILTKGQAGCRGPIEACHEGEKKPGTSMKSADSKAIAMCRRHHREWGRPWKGGFFAAMTPEQRREWADARGAASEALTLSHGARRMLC